jgi:hypothetical protein
MAKNRLPITEDVPLRSPLNLEMKNTIAPIIEGKNLIADNSEKDIYPYPTQKYSRQ